MWNRCSPFGWSERMRSGTPIGDSSRLPPKGVCLPRTLNRTPLIPNQVPQPTEVQIVAHVLGLRHVLDVVNHLPKSLEGPAPRRLAFLFGGLGQRIQKELPRVSVGIVLVRVLVFVFQRPVRRTPAVFAPTRTSGNIVVRIIEMVRRSRTVVLEFRTVFD